MRSLVVPCALLLLLDLVLAVKLPFHVHVRRQPSPSLHTRSSISGTTNTSSADNSSIPVANTQNAFYISNITLGGTPKAVMLDTGSSDLWVTGDVPGTKDLGKAVTLSYAVGQAKGDVNTAIMTFDDYTVNDQAYLLVTNTSTFSTDISADGYDGLIGLGPNSGSVIRDKVDSSAGDNPISRIFQQNRTTNNFISFILDRKNDPGANITGQLTISEYVPGYEAVANAEKLDVETVRRLTKQDQHWTVLLDKEGLIGPSGDVIEHKSIVSGVPKGQLAAVIDSGFTLAQVPRTVSDAIYGRVQGAQYDTSSQLWLVPCGQEINVTIKLGGVSFPVHPLDTSSNDFSATDSNGNHICVGTFQPITSAFSLLGEYDMILGMSFLRNAYTLLDYGDFISGTSTDRGDPYVQMLPLTDSHAAHLDFVNVRLDGVDTTGASQYALLPESQTQHSPESKAEKEQHLKGEVLRHWPEIFVGAFVVFCALVGLIVWKCCCRRRRQKAVANGSAPFNPRSRRQKYQSLQEPAPQVHMQNLGSQDPYARV